MTHYTIYTSHVTLALLALAILTLFFGVIPLHQVASRSQQFLSTHNHHLVTLPAPSFGILQNDTTATQTRNSSSSILTEKPDLEVNFTTYPLHLSTEKYHSYSALIFHGPFAHIRSKLDYTYHSNYTPQRQHLQDTILYQMLNNTFVTDYRTRAICPVPSHHNWIVFTAGAMGAGKTHTIRTLHQKGHFPLEAFVSVDPDEIRRHLPEFELYAKYTPQTAGEMTRKEAGYMSEILTSVALENRKNVLVDGSLRDEKWYGEYFRKLRGEYEQLKIGILHVKAPRGAVLQRAAKRSLETGRVVPLKTLEDALEQVPKSVKILAPQSDFFCELNNASDSDIIELLTEGMSWKSFQKVWEQSCPRSEDSIWHGFFTKS